MSKDNFKDVPNLGKILISDLKQVEITTIEQLKAIGAKSVFLKLKSIDNNACINTLYALEGAVEGVRWHNISKERKIDLLDFFHSIKK